MWESKEIDSVETLIREAKKDCKEWGLGKAPWLPWFRGEPSCDTPLVPRLYRKSHQDDYLENRLLQSFRTRAMAYGKTPHRDETDQWLFIARHVGLPTRLLDWTEGCLVALYFVLLKPQNAIIWMLDPFRLNALACNQSPSDLRYNIYPLTWYVLPGEHKNIGSENIRGAWEGDGPGMEMPVAISPTYVHQEYLHKDATLRFTEKERRVSAHFFVRKIKNIF